MDIVPDSNNNTSGEKSYSLRPRTTLKKDEDETDQEDSWKPRGRSKKRSKQKCLPLSKYRRKTANARERSRMREINDAFESLRKALPHFNARNDNPNEKTTKIMTLRLAMKYITALDSALRQADGDSDGESLISDYSMNSREHSLTPSSSSEQSDIFDQLFISSSFDDYSTSTSFSNSAIPSLLSEALRSPSRSSTIASSKFETPLPFLKLSLTPISGQLSRIQAQSSSEASLPLVSRSSQPKPPSLSNYSLITTNNLHHPDCQPTSTDPVKESLPPVDLQDYAAASWRDFDCLPSSPMNLDDLFIT